MISNYLTNIRRNFFPTPREIMISTAMEFISFNKIEGDYLEFSVYEGYTFYNDFHFAQKKNLKSMRFFAFDSFSGLPEIKGVDDNSKIHHFRKGQYFCDAEKFKKNLTNKGVNFNMITIVPGWYNEILNEETKIKLSIKKASIIWIDCDLYESTVPVLNFITDYIQNGSILIFDDWFCFCGDPNKGEQKAFKEYLKKNSSIIAQDFHKFGWHGNSFIMYRE